MEDIGLAEKYKNMVGGYQAIFWHEQAGNLQKHRNGVRQFQTIENTIKPVILFRNHFLLNFLQALKDKNIPVQGGTEK